MEKFKSLFKELFVLIIVFLLLLFLINVGYIARNNSNPKQCPPENTGFNNNMYCLNLLRKTTFYTY